MKKSIFFILFFTMFGISKSFVSNENETKHKHKVSWYGDKFHGRKTASGEKFNMYRFTCAATKQYKFGDLLRVTNIENGKSVDVYVNDRGGFKKYGRTLDLSKAAFDKIGDLKKGELTVYIELLNPELNQPIN